MPCDELKPLTVGGALAVRRLLGHMDPEVVEACATEVDHALARLASRQHGVIARRQLLEIGLTPDQIRHRCDRGRLYPAHRGVYLVGHTAVTEHGHWLAAVLACGDGAVLSHRFAAALWGLGKAPAARIEVTVGPGGRGARPGIAVHRTRRLASAERTTHHRIPVTTVSRTLFDLAAVVFPSQLRLAFEIADRLELLDLHALETLCQRSSGLRGSGRLREILVGYREAPLTRSALEHSFVSFCRRAGLPVPAVNVAIAGLEVDCVWPDRRVVVELDGYAFHRGRIAFERDRSRDAKLTLAGYTVLRLTHRRLREEAATVAQELRSLLAIERR